jgi:hypothetical protein
MSFIPEESKREAELRRKVEDISKDDPNIPTALKSKKVRSSSSAKEKAERAKKDYEQKQKTLEYKRERLEWQKERSKIKDKLAKEAEEKRKAKYDSNIKIEPISDKDRDPTAYKKAIGAVSSVAKVAVKAGASALANKIKKQREERKQEEDQRKERTFEVGKKKTKKKIDTAMAQKLLPPAPSQMSGREKRTAISQGKYLGKGRVSEEYSCWREEFLYELGDMRRKKNKKNKKNDEDDNYIVDIMKGTNTITIGPTIRESLIAEKKRDQLANALLGLAFASSAAQSPEALIRSGHIESPGIQLMSRMMSKRKEADKNLDSGRVSHPARNIKKKSVKEELSTKDLLKAIVKKLIDEKKRKNYLLNTGYIGESSAWQRKEGKNPEGGLNKKGIASYRRENPGSKLSLAVTTPPSKLKSGSKAANRRKSFCARMGGMPGPMKDEKGRPTRKALSLKKWNC